MAFIGIDLGTTNSLAAIWRGGAVVLIPNVHGEYLTPSVISVLDDQRIVVGRSAKDRLVTHPASTVSQFKRLMGTSSVTTINGIEFSPEELSAVVLRQLKEDAEHFLGDKVDEAIISVPAYFDDNQRNATKIAANLAGLKVERLINEPTAAAIAYGVHNDEKEKHFIVVDLGGGTFDVSLMEKFDDLLEVHASAGDSHLGGEDFTAALLSYIADKQGVNEQLLTAHERGRLYRQLEEAKKRLSTEDQIEIELSITGKSSNVLIKQEELLGVFETLLKRMALPIERAVRDAGLNLSEIHDVFLVGGATRMPLIRQFFTRLLGRFPACHIDPDHVVVMGAAIQAALKQRNKELGDIVLTDVTPFSLGVSTSTEDGHGGYISGIQSVIIERNTTIPVSRAHSYTTVQDGQKEICFEIFQGEHLLAKQNIRIGELLVNIPKNSAGKESVEVRFTYDINGLLEVIATVRSTSVRKRTVIQNSDSRLSEKEIEIALQKIAGLKIHPREQELNKALMARAERIYAEQLGHDREALKKYILRFECAMSSQDEQEASREAKFLKEYLDVIEQGFWQG
jgi:molecular chaperone HscC